MPRNLDTTMAAELAKGGVRPFYLGELNFASGVQRVWSGVGPITWNGKTFSGLGELVSVGAIAESSDVRANGTTVGLNVLPSMLDIPPLGVTPPDPPRATRPGESMAWALATRHSGAGLLEHNHPPGILLPGGGYEYAWCSSTLTTGDIEFIVGSGLEANTLANSWDGFLSLAIPPSAPLTAVYGLVVPGTTGGNSETTFIQGSYSITTAPSGTPVLFPANSLADLEIVASLQDTVSSPCSFTQTFVGVAVYYMGSPLTKTSLLYEATSDVRVGAPAKIWFGFLSSSGAIVGTPFLAFSGLVDEPSIDEDPAGTKIVLALENRLRNLQRASQKRYTAADQKLSFPNDSGYNWVELLNEISLHWGA